MRGAVPYPLWASQAESLPTDMIRRARKTQLTWRKLIVPAVAAMALTVLPATTSGATVASKSQHHQTRTAAALGVYAGPSNVAGVNAFQNLIGTKVSYVMDFVDGSSWSTIAHPSNLNTWAPLGYKTIWGVPMLPNRGGTLAAGASGAYDQNYVSLARALVAAGQGSVVIRIGWEFNGVWFPWAAVNHAAQFDAYYRHIVVAMRSVAGTHFTFEWNPSRGNVGAGNLAAYWPGNAYVTYVGLDVFVVEWQSYPGTTAEFQQMLNEQYGLNWLTSFASAHHKPIVLPEWGLGWGTCSNTRAVTGSGAVCGGDNAFFIKSMTKWIATHNVFEASYWDYGSSLVTRSENKATGTALRTYWAASATSSPSSPTTRARSKT
jgi:hypothetical protein